MTLENAFAEYRAGNCRRAVALLSKLLGDGQEHAAPLSQGNSSQELMSRALDFLAAIAPEPSARETAAALIMVAALLNEP